MRLENGAVAANQTLEHLEASLADRDCPSVPNNLVVALVENLECTAGIPFQHRRDPLREHFLPTWGNLLHHGFRESIVPVVSPKYTVAPADLKKV